MNYGAYVGTGVTGAGGAVMYGLSTSSYIILTFSVLLIAAALIGLVRRLRRTDATQRP